MREFDFQTEAIRKLISTSNDLLGLEGNHSIIFKSPTGSGKTIMMAEFLKEFVTARTDDLEFSFIWTAPRKLHIQSWKKLTEHYKDSMMIKCSGFDDLVDNTIRPNEILFLNWESINREDNIYYRENEQEFYLEKIIENTIDDNRIIVLIIDESHHTAGADNTQGLIGLINARLTIAVSATPQISGDEVVNIYRQKVVAEELIKKQIVINPDFSNSIIESLPNGDLKILSSAKESTNDYVIRMALEKRKELHEMFIEESASINPLMIIQLPDRRHGQLGFKDEIIDILKTNHDVTIENGRLAVYLTDDKENLENITRNDSSVEVMIFKQAIALGWDCPRASILVLFRDWRSIVFSIQTVGRIMRMPELKHYRNNSLNDGYIFTNLDDISIHQDIADGYATINHSHRIKENYKKIQLLSCHSVRQRERTRLTPKFVNVFLECADELNLKANLDTDIDRITTHLISDGVVTNPDEEFEHLANEQQNSRSAESVERQLQEEEIQILFDNFSKDALSPLYPEERSIKRINKAIYEFFHQSFPLQLYEYADVKIQMIVLSRNNRQIFLDAINLSITKYLAEIEDRVKEIVEDKNWDIPVHISYSNEYIQKDYSLSVMQPFFEKRNASEIEKAFGIMLSNKVDEIDWWFKNGERDGTFFAVPRMDNDNQVPFYVDWIVMYTDGRIGLFDTKAGITAEAATSRAIGLADYISSQNKEGKNLIGGIVIEKNDTFWLNSNKDYQFDEDDLLGTGWNILS